MQKFNDKVSRVKRSFWAVFVLTLGLFSASALAQGGSGISAQIVLDRFSDLPIDMTRGTFNYAPEIQDITVKSPNKSLNVARYYNSDNKESSMFGQGWNWSHGDHLEFNYTDGLIEVVTQSGRLPVLIDSYVVSRWSTEVSSAKRWANVTKATGPEDGLSSLNNNAYSLGLGTDSGTLSAGKWGFQTLDDTYISKVEVLVKGSTLYHPDSPNGLKLRLSAGGASELLWGHAYMGWSSLDVTSDRVDSNGDSIWTWQDIHALKANISAGTFTSPQARNTDVFIDTFAVRVHYSKLNEENYAAPEAASYTFDKIPHPTDSMDHRFLLTYKNGSTIEFHSDGRAHKKTDPFGHSFSYFYDTNNLLTNLTDEVNQKLEFYYGTGENSNRVVKIGSPVYDYVHYNYDDGNLTGFTNLMSNSWSYSYETLSTHPELTNTLETVSGPEGYTIAVDYFALPSEQVGKVRSFIDPEGKAVLYAYRDYQTFAGIAGSGSIEGLEYNDKGNISSVFIREGDIPSIGSYVHEIRDEDRVYIYDLSNRIIASIRGGVTNFFGYKKGQVETHTDGAGYEWNYLYETNYYKVAAKYDPDGGLIFTNTYNDVGNIVRVENANGEHVSYGFNTNGLLVATTNARNFVSSQLYDTNGLHLLETYDFNSNKVEYLEYDVFGHATKIIGKRGLLDVLYNPYGKKIWQQDALGLVTEYHYDGLLRLTNEVVAVGDPVYEARTRYGYDKWSRLLAVTNAEDEVTSYEYNSFGWKTKTVKPGPAATLYRYDLYGRVTNVVDAINNQVSYRYDARGNEIEKINARGFKTISKYDGNNRLIYRKDVGGNEVEFDYDYFGKQTRQVASFNKCESCPEALRPLPLVTLYDYDAARRLTNMVQGARQESPRVTQYAYDATGNKKLEVAPDGTSFNYIYDGNNNLISKQVVDATTGNTLLDQEYAYNALNLMTNLTDRQENGDEFVTQWLYDSSGRNTEHIDSRGETTYKGYSPLGFLTAFTNAAMETSSITYDKIGRRVEETDLRGLTTYYNYGAYGFLTNKTHGVSTQANRRVYGYSYDGMGRMTNETLIVPEANSFLFSQLSSRVFDYDEVGNLTYEAQWKGSPVTYLEYDALNNVSVRRDSLGYENNIDSDGRGNPWFITNKRGFTTSYKYNVFGELILETTPEGVVNEYGYDQKGRKVREVGPSGLVSEYQYDGLDRLVLTKVGEDTDTPLEIEQIYNRLGKEVEIVTRHGDLERSITNSYDSVGNLVEAIDRRGYKTSYSNDAMNRVILKTDAYSNDTQYVYNSKGDLYQVVDALGHTEEYELDLFGNLKKEIQKDLNLVTTYLNDGFDGAYSRIDPEGIETYLAHDIQGRLWFSVPSVQPIGYIQYFYNDRGFVEEQLKHAGQGPNTWSTESFTTNGYDEVGNLTYTRTYDRNMPFALADDVGIRHEFDKDNRRTKKTVEGDDQDWVWTYAYDGAGRLFSMTDPEGLETKFTYDEFNRETSRIVGGSRVFRKVYDQAGRVFRDVDPLGNYVEFHYDEEDRIRMVQDKRGFVTEFVYDRLGRKTKEIQPLSTITETFYDAVGNVSSVINPLSKEAFYYYDKANRKTNQIDFVGTSSDYEYYKNGRLYKEINASNVVTKYSYEEIGKVRVKVFGEGLPDSRIHTFSHDGLGKKGAAFDAEGTKTLWRYDFLDRVSEVNVFDSSGQHLRRDAKYVYDELGNILNSIDALDRTTTFEYNKQGRLTKQINPDNTEINFVLNQFGEIVKSIDPLGNVTQSSYDALGRVIRVVDPLGNTSRLEYDENGNVIMEVDDNGNAIVREYDALNRLIILDESMRNTSNKKIMDINNDGLLNEKDVEALQILIP